MGKKYKKMNLGRSLIKDRFGMKRCLKVNGDHYHHSEDMKDGYNWGLLNLKSVTEESSFQEFFTTAELVEAKYQAEKLNVKFIDSKKDTSSISKEKSILMQLLNKNNQVLKIPRRPKWDKTMTAEELQIKEKTEFYEWRKKLSSIKEISGFEVTPYEKNIEFWRQLWRVIERSDIIVQIVDARNPLLFRCEDLEEYVKEVNSNKVNIVLLNKADFLTKRQRKIWAKYFSSVGIQIAFFSTILTIQNEDIKYSHKKDNSSEEENDLDLTYISNLDEGFTFNSCNGNLNISNILDRKGLISLFKSFYVKQNYKNPITVGLIGYPNVGKSSIVNALFMEKKVSVSPTPGKTKHFQTLYLNKDLILCDCPGVVMPSIVKTKAEMILNGILPINHIQDYITPMNLLGKLIPRHVIEKLYGIMIPFNTEAENINQSLTGVEILDAHGYNRGFMTQSGQPDNARSARFILNDFLTGKLLYCTAPPNYSQNKFHSFTSKKEEIHSSSSLQPETIKIVKPTIKDLDKTFFQKNTIDFHIKGKNIQLKSNSNSTIGSVPNLYRMKKPWKINKNSIKKES